MANKLQLLPALCLLTFLVRCSMGPLAGGSDNPDFLVVGTIVDPDGKPAQNTVVTITPSTYNPVTDTAPAGEMMDTTDEIGTYHLTVGQQGPYTIEAVHLKKRTRLLVTGISVTIDTTDLAIARLTATGSVKVSLPSSGINATTGYVYVPGTGLCAFLNKRTDTVVLDSAPSGTLPMIFYTATNLDSPVPLRFKIPVYSGNTTVVANTAWKYCRRIQLNTTSSGAGTTAMVTDFPVLIRLNGDNFDFREARPDGTDCRFTGPGNAALAFEIERWDTAGRQAEIWVNIDTIHGNNDSQTIAMYWGNPNATGMSNSTGVFDTSRGFTGIWHLNEAPSAGSASIKDRTTNGYHATPYGYAAATGSIAGAIGNALTFDGKNDYLNAGNVPVSGNYSIGAWVLLDTLETYQRLIYKNDSYTLWYDRDEVSLRMEHMDSAARWRGLIQDGGTRVTMSKGTWSYVVATFDGIAVRLYKNGVAVSTSDPIPVVPANTADPLFFGISDKSSFVNGAMDEIRIEGTARGADWIRLCYMNQRQDDKLIVFLE